MHEKFSKKYLDIHSQGKSDKNGIFDSDIRFRKKKKTVIFHSLRCYLIGVKFGSFRFYPLTLRET